MPTTTHPDELITVEEWRLAVLTEAGYPKALAHTIAACTDIDLHTAIRLLHNGCTPHRHQRLSLSNHARTHRRRTD